MWPGKRPTVTVHSIMHSDFNRLNLFGKYQVNLSPRNQLKITLSTFSSGWRSSGEIPERAVAEGLIGRWGYIDSAQGGYTSRTNAILRLNSALSDNWQLENQGLLFALFFQPAFRRDFFRHGQHQWGSIETARDKRSLWL